MAHQIVRSAKMIRIPKSLTIACVIGALIIPGLRAAAIIAYEKAVKMAPDAGWAKEVAATAADFRHKIGAK